MKLAAGLLVALVCSGALASEAGQRTLTFEDRVRAQEAIERVYHSHQIGATVAFEMAVPRAVLESKVNKYLEETAALKLYWKTEVTDEMLQRELERMATGTRMPERLLELYAALGNDPFLVKECLARATLVDRLARNFFAYDDTIHAQARARAEELYRQLKTEELSPMTDHPDRSVIEFAMDEPGAAISVSQKGAGREMGHEKPLRERLSADEFRTRRSLLSDTPGQASTVEEERDAFAVSVLLSETTRELVVANYVVPKTAWDAWWEETTRTVRGDSIAAVASERNSLAIPGADLGGMAAGAERSSGLGSRKAGANSPSCEGDNRWDNGILDDVLENRNFHSAIWTGSLMVIWGGQGIYDGYLNTGSRYDPATDTWAPTSTVGAPSRRRFHTAVWTGSRMVVWGGLLDDGSLHFLNTGGRYDPSTDTWTPMATAGDPSGREYHTAVWTGSVMVVWGGADATTYFNTGGRYDPATDAWTATSTTGAPSGRWLHSAVWTGSRMVVWGGESSVGLRNTGGQYNPATDTWTATSTSGAPSARRNHTAIWTGSLMVVWGGGGYLNTGGRYDPATDAWTPTSTTGAPSGRDSHTAVWTGSLMVIWGGYNGGYLNTGGRYNPATDAWTPTSTTGASSGRWLHSALWTGSRMLVWGGWGSVGVLNTGGRYDPLADAWTPTTTSPVGAPSNRDFHTATWSGSVMVVWGGYNGGYLNTGGRYDPVTDVWTPTSTTNAPSARYGHTAIWTGSLMVVWGGYGGAFPTTGGRYNPSTDSWTATSTSGAPSPRLYHSTIWTGNLMVVWGGAFYDGASWHDFDTGGRYNPATDAWTPTSTTGATSARDGHTAVWTGSEMVVWGGADEIAYLNTGGRYNPATNSWTPTSTTNAPSARYGHTATWTGGLMVAWGGYFYDGSYHHLSTGGRYNPATDSWMPTATTGAPSPRANHTAVWTGSLMVVWGGADAIAYFNTGGRYDPATDYWTPTSSTLAPAARWRHTAVWTGSLMVVWGGYNGGVLDIGGRYFYSGILEVCNGIDDNCDGRVDEGFDRDGDGFTTCGGDCDDDNDRTYPGAPEICDNRDNNCNGVVDNGVNLDVDQDGFTTCQGDCDDTDASKDPRPGHGCDSANNGRAQNAPITSDPVNVATGNFTQEDTDFRIAGRGIDLVFSRQYNSKSSSDGPLGWGWTNSFQLRLVANPDSSRTATMEDGHSEIYSPDGAGGFTPPYGLWNKLAANAGGTFSLTRKEDRLRFDFDSAGVLQKIVDKNGNQIACGYVGGLLTTLTDAVGRVVSLTYNPSNRIERIDFPVGRSIQYAYGPAGDLTGVTDARGYTTEYTYDADHQLLTIEDRRNNVVVTNIYDATNRVVSSQHDAYGAGTTFLYDWVANKTDVTDPLGKTTIFWYDSFGKTLRVRDPLGNELSYIYDGAGQRTSMTDKAAKTTQFTYDARGNMLTRTDPDTAVTTFEYDANDRVLKRIDPLLFQETFAYDANGNQTQWVDRTGKTEARTYTPQGQLSTVVDRRGKTTSYVYLSDGTLDTTNDRLSKVSSFTHDGAGRRLTARDPNLNTTTYTYDANDHVTEVMDALGRVTHYGFDADGNSTTVEDPSGAITTTFYDLKSHVEKVRDPLLHDTTYEYDADDRKTADVDPRGNRTESVYDDVGNLRRVKDALLHESLFTYDAAGRRLTAKDPENNVTSWTYDAMGRVLTVKDPLLNTTTKTYDLRGDELTSQDPRGKLTHYERDGEQRLTAIVDALGGRSEFTFDEEGNRKTLRNANLHVTNYTYDDAGNLLTVTDPLGNMTEYGYDDGGRRVLRKDAFLRPTTYVYDSANRLQRVAYPDTTMATFTYSDSPRNRTMTDATGTTTWLYDVAGRTTSVQDGAGRVLSYVYDTAGNQTSMTLPGPLSVAYTYDALNRLSTVSDWALPAGVATYAYSPAGRIAGVMLPNGTNETLQYDVAGRMTRQTANGVSGTIVDYVIDLDPSGNRTAIEKTQPLSGSPADADEACLYDAGERLLSRGSGVYGHDANGNMTTRMDERGTHTFAYDFDDRMSGVARGALSDLYSYDAEGNRVRADRATSVIQYLLDRTAPMVDAVAEYDGLGNPVRYNIHGHRLLWSLNAEGSRSIYHTDPVGSVTAVTDDSQNVTAAYDYDEFGEVIANSGIGWTNECFVGSLGVTREPADLYFMRARHYDARLGRFLSKDPIENRDVSSQWANAFLYGANDPLGKMDPRGTNWLWDAAGFAGKQGVGFFSGLPLVSQVMSFTSGFVPALDSASASNPGAVIQKLGDAGYSGVGGIWNDTIKSALLVPDAFDWVAAKSGLQSSLDAAAGVTGRSVGKAGSGSLDAAAWSGKALWETTDAAAGAMGTGMRRTFDAIDRGMTVYSAAVGHTLAAIDYAVGIYGKLVDAYGDLLIIHAAGGHELNVTAHPEQRSQVRGECIKSKGGSRCN